MENQLRSVETFLRDYERNVIAGNMPALLAQFADPFLAATPQGTKTVSAADFAQGLPARKQLFDRVGRNSSTLADIHTIPLGARYTLALTKWRFSFAQTQDNPQDILVDTAFIVDTGAGEFKIILYLAGDDVKALIKERGILKS